VVKLCEPRPSVWGPAPIAMLTSFARRALALAAVVTLAPSSPAQFRTWTDSRVEVCNSVCTWPVYPAAWEQHFVGWHVRSTHVVSFDYLVRNNVGVPFYGSFVGEFLEYFGDLEALLGGGTPGCIWGHDGYSVFQLQGPGVLWPGQVGQYTAFSQQVAVFPSSGCAGLFGAPGEVYRWADQSSLSTDAYAYVPALSVQDRSTLERWHEFKFDFSLPWMTPAGASCASNRNSTGASGRLDAYGSHGAADELVLLVASSVPNGMVGFFLMSATTTFLPSFGGSQGNLCLGAPQLRLMRTVGLVVDFEHEARLDFGTLPGGTRITAGSTWHFQFWHRDANPMPTSNTTERLSLTFR
jgi:hypothetical protein